MTGPSSGIATAVAAVLGASAALLLWLALAAPLAMGLVHPWPVPPPHDAPAIAPTQPTHDTDRATHRSAAILLSQAGTEITDFLAPYAILTASGAFTAVHAVAPTLDVVPLNGGLGVVPELTLEQLDARYPDGVDVVVLPNVLDPESPLLRDWVRRQAAQGAQVASVCEGARLLAGTALLDGRAATSHWAALGSLREAHPTVQWRNDRRWVEDGPFLTSAGVTAAIDASLRLVARAAGDETAARTATALHLPPPRDPASPPTELTAGDGITAVLDAGFVWPKRRVLVPLDDGVAELPLAALLDAWPRTFAARAASVSPDRRAVRSRSGLVLVPMLDASAARDGDLVLAPSVAGEPAFDAALRSIARALGGAPAALAARQLELPVAHLRLEDFPTSRAGALLALALLLATGAGAGVALRRHRQRRRARRASAKDDGAHALRDAAPSA